MTEFILVTFGHLTVLLEETLCYLFHQDSFGSFTIFRVNKADTIC